MLQVNNIIPLIIRMIVLIIALILFSIGIVSLIVQCYRYEFVWWMIIYSIVFMLAGILTFKFYIYLRKNII